MTSSVQLQHLVDQILSCSSCSDLPLGPRPVLQISSNAKILVASQAPGTKAHASGIPFSDASGDHLRDWMAVTPDEFYDSQRVAIVPMALCYPGRGTGGGDAPPRRECASLWRAPLLQSLEALELTLLVGTYAQDGLLGPGRMTDRVRNFEAYLPDYFPLPHPSWRSRTWMARNPWFETHVLPRLRQEVAARLGRSAT